MIKAGSEVRLILLDGNREVFRSRTECVALCKEGLPYDVYVGEKELQHFTTNEPWMTRKCLECDHLLGHDPTESRVRC